MKTLKYIIAIIFLLPLTVFAEEISFSIDCDKETYKVNETMICTIISTSDTAYRSFQANLALDSILTLESFEAKTNNIEIVSDGKTNQTISLKAKSDFTIPAETYELGILKIKIGNSEEEKLEDIKIEINEIRIFGGTENNFSEYQTSTPNVIKEVNISLGEENPIEDGHVDKEMQYEGTNDAVPPEENIDVNPKTGNFSIIVIALLSILTITTLVIYLEKYNKQEIKE